MDANQFCSDWFLAKFPQACFHLCLMHPRALKWLTTFANSMDKARKLGWHGYLDTHRSIRSIFEQMVDLKMIPPLAKKANE